MLSDIEALERAYTYWRITGNRIEVDHIHGHQRAEGHEPCFGGDANRCECANCRYHDLCVLLMQTPQVGETLWLTLQTDDVA